MTRRLVAAAVVALACTPGPTAGPTEGKDQSMSSSDHRSLVEDIGHVKLPASASGLQVHAERGADAAVWARFELPAAEVDGFLAGAGYGDLSSTQRAVANWHMPTRAPWWTPDALASFRSGKLRRETGSPRYAGHVLVGGDGERRTVYLFVTGL
jgi:hypothetical protein